MLQIIVRSATVERPMHTTAAHPRTTATVPMWLSTAPYVRPSAIVPAALLLMCCHRIEINPNMNPSPISPSAACDTDLEGKGLTSISDPSSLTSWCHPGNVCSKAKHINVKTMAMKLRDLSTYTFLEGGRGEKNRGKPTSVHQKPSYL